MKNNKKGVDKTAGSAILSLLPLMALTTPN
jgi:hypothetical protein